MPAADEPRSLPWIEKLIRIDSTSRNSNRPVIDLVAAELRALGVDVEIFASPEGEHKANLFATIPAADGSTDGGVMLSGHSDVVPVDDQDWSSDPFEPTVRDGRLYGRGSCDMKAFIGVFLAAVPAMLEAELSEPIHLAISYDEEVGCIGGAELAKTLADIGRIPESCIVGEPSNMEVIRGHKSINLVEVVLHGVAAHSSLPTIGVNAIEFAGPLINEMHAIATEWERSGARDAAYPIAHSTASINLIRGGIATNTVPDRCSLQMDFRTLPEDDPELVFARVEEMARHVEAEMKAKDERAHVEVLRHAATPGLETPADSPVIERAQRWGGEPSEGKVTYGTEAGLFSHVGMQTVVCGPGDIAQAHAADEFVSLEQIERCERFIAALVAELDTSA